MTGCSEWIIVYNINGPAGEEAIKTMNVERRLCVVEK
jgi:hypothetical protein